MHFLVCKQHLKTDIITESVITQLVVLTLLFYDVKEGYRELLFDEWSKTFLTHSDPKIYSILISVLEGSHNLDDEEVKLALDLCTVL